MGRHSRTGVAWKFGALLLALSLVLFASGCKKKVAAAPPPPPPRAVTPPPAPAKPAITAFEAEPSTVNKGGDSTLSWAVTGQTTEINIAPGIGTIEAKGTRRVFPSNTTVYTLTATGPGGTDTRDVTVNVSQPAAAPPVQATTPDDGIRTLSDLVNRDVQDVYFDYDKYDIREDARATLTRDADVLKSAFGRFGTGTILVEGHADERGSAEYNLGLADRRATSAREFLVQLGVDANRLKTVSYGKERPQCTDANESCWQKNRRAHFTVQ
jgi:peptidoglycan-associated lipoprotein